MLSQLRTLPPADPERLSKRSPSSLEVAWRCQHTALQARMSTATMATKAVVPCVNCKSRQQPEAWPEARSGFEPRSRLLSGPYPVSALMAQARPACVEPRMAEQERPSLSKQPLVDYLLQGRGTGSPSQAGGGDQQPLTGLHACPSRRGTSPRRN